MRYLITCDLCPPFLTNWYEFENNYNAELNMVVYDLKDGIYTKDGENWEHIIEDHL